MAVSGEAPRPVELRGRWGLLRPLDPARDAASLFQLTHDAQMAETWVEMKVGPFADAAVFRAHLDDCVTDSKRAFYAVADNDDRPLGWLCLMEVYPEHRSAELGYVTFAPAMQRSVLATEAFYLILSYVFGDLEFTRLEWTCTAGNHRSQRAAERLGFTLEGVMRRKLLLKGKVHDIPLYSMLADEWPAVRASMQRWLDPSNFDEAGVQRQPLRVP